MVPGKRSGGQCSDSTSVTVHAPYVIGSPGVATTMSSSPRPRPTLAVDVPPTRVAPVRAATTAESMTWSKWLCTGSTASSRSTPARRRQASMRSMSGAMVPSTTRPRLGLLKKPSVISAEVPSSSSRVETPRKVTDSPAGPAAGTSNRWAYGVSDGRPRRRRMPPFDQISG
jgi:hypothetical protein